MTSIHVRRKNKVASTADDVNVLKSMSNPAAIAKAYRRSRALTLVALFNKELKRNNFSVAVKPDGSLKLAEVLRAEDDLNTLQDFIDQLSQGA